jgi:hAT family C-terminal dimerisation region
MSENANDDKVVEDDNENASNFHEFTIAGKESNPETPPRKKRRLCMYNPEWEKEFSWVVKCCSFGNEQNKARCKLCNTSVTVAYEGVKALTQHGDSQKHKNNVAAAAASQRIHNFFVIKDNSQTEKVNIAELTHVFHGVKHHNSFVAQDCTIKIMKQIIPDSEIVKKITAGRTKSSAIVNNVLYPYSLELVLDDLQNGLPFSVATDATNKGNRKVYPVVVQYFTASEGMCYKILDFYEDSFEDSASIKSQLCRVLHEKGLSWSNVTAYGADNASVNYGVNNSVYQKLVEQENENIIAAHCNDHILHNCAKNALKVLSFDIENLVLKVFAEFSNSAKKREELKECFAFCESEFHEVVRHVPTRWLSLFKAVERLLLSWKPLKAYFLALGSDECAKAIWNILSDQENEISSDEEPTFSELYLFFTHYFMSCFQETLLKLENRSTTACDLYLILEKFRESLRRKIDDKFFGMKVKLAFRRNYLPDRLVQKFTQEALLVYTRALTYLEKWFSFNNSPYCKFTALSLGNLTKPPTLDEVIEIWMMSPWKNDVPPDDFHDELGALEFVFPSLPRTSSLDKWRSFFEKESAPNLLKIVQYVMSIPVSNANVERIFSVMGNVWTDERNCLCVESVRSELCIFFNIPYTCTEFKDAISKNKKLLKAVESNIKYNYMNKK